MFIHRKNKIKAPNAVNTKIIGLNQDSGIFLTTKTPAPSPSPTAGSNHRSINKVFTVIVFHTQMWKGSLKTLIKKNSQAAVPIKACLGKRIAKKNTLEKAPAKFPIIVVMPAISPVDPANAQ